MKGEEPKAMSEVLDRMEKRGEMNATKLTNYLWKNGRGDDAVKAVGNEVDGIESMLLYQKAAEEDRADTQTE